MRTPLSEIAHFHHMGHEIQENFITAPYIEYSFWRSFDVNDFLHLYRLFMYSAAEQFLPVYTTEITCEIGNIGQHAVIAHIARSQAHACSSQRHTGRRAPRNAVITQQAAADQGHDLRRRPAALLFALMRVPA